MNTPCLTLASLSSAFLLALAGGQEPTQSADESRGLQLNEAGAFDGYTLLSPLASKSVFLLDMRGEVVHRWDTDGMNGGSIYLLDNGNLLCLCFGKENPRFTGPGVTCGLMQEVNWDGDVVWEYLLSDDFHLMHHDVEPLPNGNILLITWEAVEREDAIAWGRDADQINDAGLWMDAVFEIERIGSVDAEVVWEWHVWDHLVQDRDPALRDFGSVPDHPGRIDINADHRDRPPMSPEEIERMAEIERQMRALGYAGGDEEEEAAAPRSGTAPDWLHTNSVDYLPEYDLIVLSTPHLDELWVIDHSTTTEEAAGASGGRWGHGGDLLWRWGNPRVYGHGEDGDRALFYQHNPTWIEGEHPTELRLLLFNNGGGRPGGDHSSLDELVLPFDPERGFLRDEGRPFGPTEPVWSYSAPGAFFSPFISGAQRLPNGNTLACSGVPGRIFEVTYEGRIVWEFLNPYEGEPIEVPGSPPRTAVFRATRVPKDHPGLQGRDL